MRTNFVLTILVAAVFAGCGQSAGPAQGAAGTAAQGPGSSGVRDAHDPCGLLDPKEVEAVVGPLAGPPFRTREGAASVEPEARGDTCAYQTPDFRTILLTVTWKDGPIALKAISLPGRILGGGAAGQTPEGKAAKTLLPGGMQIDGEWDEAQSFGCCQIYALRGDQLISFDYRGWRDDTAHAVGLLNKALVRLEHPLPIDGTAGNEAAGRRAGDRPKPRPACSLLSRADAEAILGPLLADPHAAATNVNESCTYRFTQQASKQSPLNDAPDQFKSMIGALTGGRGGMVTGPVDTGVQINWRNGFRQLNDAALVGGAVGANFAGTPGMPKRTTGRVTGGPWDEAGQTSLTFTAVKNDVGITIDTDPTLSMEQVELRRRLVAKMIERLAVKE